MQKKWSIAVFSEVKFGEPDRSNMADKKKVYLNVVSIEAGHTSIISRNKTRRCLFLIDFHVRCSVVSLLMSRGKGRSLPGLFKTRSEESGRPVSFLLPASPKCIPFKIAIECNYCPYTCSTDTY